MRSEIEAEKTIRVKTTAAKKTMEVEIRKASLKDLPEILRVEKRSYPPWLQATKNVLKERIEKAIVLVAVEKQKRKILGFTTCVPANLNLPSVNVEKIMQNRHPHYQPWLREYLKNFKSGNFDTLWVMSTAVESKHQNKGVGSELIKATLNLAKKLDLSYRASALKCEYHKKRKGTETIKEYLARVKKGEVKDRFLQPYLKLGFELGAPLPEYEAGRMPPHLNYNVLAYKKTT